MPGPASKIKIELNLKEILELQKIKRSWKRSYSLVKITEEIA
jgi:hypothetical protein